MPNNHLQPVIDLYPWPGGLGFKNAASWWKYVGKQTESDKLDLLMTMALLSENICQLLLNHNQALFDKFQLSPQTIRRLSAIQADGLTAFANALVAQDTILFESITP